MSAPASRGPTESSATGVLTDDAGMTNARMFGQAIHVRQDRGTTWLVVLCGALLATIALGLAFGHFAKTEPVRGYVSATSGVTRLSAHAPGVIQTIHVRQGDLVRAGQPIASLQLRDVSANGVSTVEATLAGLRQRRANLVEDRKRAQAFLDLVRNDTAELGGNAGAVLKAMDQQEREIQGALGKQQELVKKAREYLAAGYATRDQVNGYERAAFDYGRQLAEVRIKKAELRQSTAERTRTQQGSVFEKRAQLSTADSEIAQIDAQLANTQAQRAAEIVAPRAGQVASLLAEQGASVTPEQAIAVIADPGAEPLIVLELPSRAIGSAKVGQRVILKYDAFPFKTFGVAHGTITSISATPIKEPATAADSGGLVDPRQSSGPAAAAAARQSVYRVEVSPDSRVMVAYGRNEAIALGSTLAADIVVERRRLIDWVLDPIRALRGRG